MCLSGSGSVSLQQGCQVPGQEILDVADGVISNPLDDRLRRAFPIQVRSSSSGGLVRDWRMLNLRSPGLPRISSSIAQCSDPGQCLCCGRGSVGDMDFVELAPRMRPAGRLIYMVAVSNARRHLNTWFAFTPCARATSATLAPGFSVNCTISSFSEIDRQRRTRRSPLTAASTMNRFSAQKHLNHQRGNSGRLRNRHRFRSFYGCDPL